MQTSHPHVYAAGDITGFSQLAHTAYREGEVAVNHILGNEERMDYRAIPAVVYTNPEVAGVGKTEEELKASGEYYNLVKIPMTYSGRFVAENETGNGLCKLLTNVNGQIIGCHLVGNPASEIIVIAGIAVEHGYTVDEFKRKPYFPIRLSERRYMKVSTSDNALYQQSIHGCLVQPGSRGASAQELFGRHLHVVAERTVRHHR